MQFHSVTPMLDTDFRTAWQLFHLNWFPILGMGILLALGLRATGLRVEPVAYGIAVAIATLLLVLAYGCRIAKGELADPKLVFSLGTIGQVILTCAIVGPLSYVAGNLNWPLEDQALLAIDRTLGLDPDPIARYVNNHPWLARTLASGYGLIKFPLLGVPIVLALTARYVRLQVFMLAMSLALAVTNAISAIVTAVRADVAPKAKSPAEDGALETVRSRRPYFRLVEIEVNLVFSVVPRLFTTVMIASAMPAAIRPYSMAVAPDSSFKKRATRFFIECSK